MSEVLGNMEAAGSFTGEIDPSWFTGDIVVKEGSDGGFTFEFGVTKAGLGNKETAGGFIGEIGASSFPGEIKEAAGAFTYEYGVAKGRSMVTEASWIDYVILSEKEQVLLGLNQGCQARPTEAMITKEMVPEHFIKVLVERRPFQKHPPLTDAYSDFLSKYDPKLRELWLIDRARRSTCVDLHVDVVRQYREKGFAKVGVDFIGGVKKIFVLP